MMFNLTTSTIYIILLPLPSNTTLLFTLIIITNPLFKLSYPPAGAMISHGAESAGLAQGYAFALFNIAWAGGQVVNNAGCAGLAQATTDAVPYVVLSLVCVGTLVTVKRRGPRAQPTSQLS